MSVRSIGVVGLGYVGQPLVAALANVGFMVVGMDNDRAKIDRLITTGQPTVYEPGLAETFARSRGRIRFTPSYEDMMRAVDAVCITVGTPVDANHEPQMSRLDDAVQGIGRRLRTGQTLILRSTVTPGTTREVARTLGSLSGMVPGEDFYVAFCPERTIEGIALFELYSLPTIIGGINPESTQRAAEIFQRLSTRVIPVSSPTVAELCKLADNMYRALNIAFANEFGSLCESAGVDAFEVVRAVNDAYARTQIFRPGLGADGPCLSKDPLILRSFAGSLSLPTPMIDASIEVNRRATRRVAREVLAFLDLHDLPRPVIAFLGLAFKGMPETDDLRGSAAYVVFEELMAARDGPQGLASSFRFYDPIVREFQGFDVHSGLEEAVTGAHIVLFLSDHPSLRNIPISLVLGATARPLLVVDAWHNVARNPIDEIPADVTYVRIGDGR